MPFKPFKAGEIGHRMQRFAEGVKFAFTAPKIGLLERPVNEVFRNIVPANIAGRMDFTKILEKIYQEYSDYLYNQFDSFPAISAPRTIAFRKRLGFPGTKRFMITGTLRYALSGQGQYANIGRQGRLIKYTRVGQAGRKGEDIVGTEFPAISKDYLHFALIGSHSIAVRASLYVGELTQVYYNMYLEEREKRIAAGALRTRKGRIKRLRPWKMKKVFAEEKSYYTKAKKNWSIKKTRIPLFIFLRNKSGFRALGIIPPSIRAKWRREIINAAGEYLKAAVRSVPKK